MQNGDFDGAVDDFSRAIQLDHNYFKAYINRGTILKQKGKLDEALFDYNKAIELEPDDFKAYMARAEIWFKKKSFDKAISDYSIFIKNNPGSSIAYRGIGDAYYHKKCYQDSIKNYLKSIELNQNASFAYNNLAWIFSTCVEDKYRDGEKALLYSQKAVDLDPSSCNLSTLATAYAENNQFKKATEILKRIIDNEKVNNNFKAKLENYLVLFNKHQPIRELPEI